MNATAFLAIDGGAAGGNLSPNGLVGFAIGEHTGHLEALGKGRQLLHSEQMSRFAPDGPFVRDYIQPAGTIRVTIDRREGGAVHAYIGGPVTLDSPVDSDCTGRLDVVPDEGAVRSEPALNGSVRWQNLRGHSG